MERNIKIKTKLKQEQEAHIKRGVRKRSFLLTEKTGKGKTLTVLAIFAYLYNKGKLDKLFAFAPKNAYLKKVWEIESHTHTTLKAVSFDYLLKCTKESLPLMIKKIDEFQVIYFKHTHATKYTALINKLVREFKTVVVIDEIHNFKNPNTEKTRCLRKTIQGSKARWGVTATPLTKDLADTYNIVNLIKPDYFGTFWDFKKTYCVVAEEVVGRGMFGKLKKVEKIVGVSDEVAFKEKIYPIVLSGDNVIKPKFYKIPYKMSEQEIDMYTKIGKGIGSLDYTNNSTDWIKAVLAGELDESVVYIKSVEKHSSRFIYLQYASDGVLNTNGSLGRIGEKVKEYVNMVNRIVNYGESCIVYFSYYETLYAFEKYLKKTKPNAKILRATGKDVIDYKQITETAVKAKPHVLLCTKSASESASLYFINNALFFHVPTTPEVFAQFVGRITRINTLYPDNLRVFVPEAENIDKYKMLLMTVKAKQLEVVAGKEENIPDFYKGEKFSPKSITAYRKYLLWDNKSIQS